MAWIVVVAWFAGIRVGPRTITLSVQASSRAKPRSVPPGRERSRKRLTIS